MTVSINVQEVQLKEIEELEELNYYPEIGEWWAYQFEEEFSLRSVIKQFQQQGLELGEDFIWKKDELLLISKFRINEDKRTYE